MHHDIVYTLPTTAATDVLTVLVEFKILSHQGSVSPSRSLSDSEQQPTAATASVVLNASGCAGEKAKICLDLTGPLARLCPLSNFDQTIGHEPVRTPSENNTRNGFQSARQLHSPSHAHGCPQQGGEKGRGQGLLMAPPKVTL